MFLTPTQPDAWGKRRATDCNGCQPLADEMERNMQFLCFRPPRSRMRGESDEQRIVMDVSHRLTKWKGVCDLFVFGVPTQPDAWGKRRATDCNGCQPLADGMERSMRGAMILGTGIDIVKVERFDAVVNNESDRFMERVYHENEVKYLKDKGSASYAGVFAAKEAVVKALGTGFHGFWPDEVEIKHDEMGKPFAKLHGEARELLIKKAPHREGGGANIKIHISISHSRDDAIAFAVIESL